MTNATDDTLPDADYVLVGSRIALGLDGGFAVAVPARLRLLEEAGAPEPLMLSVDGQTPEAHAAQRRAFVDGGHVADASRIRNLFDEVVADPVGQVRRVYDATGMTLTEDVERHMRDWLQRRPRETGRPDYSAETYGLSEGMIRERFAEYERRFRGRA